MAKAHVNIGGRPTTCTPERTKAFADAITLGMPLEFIFSYAGVDKGSYYNWMERGEKGEEPYLTFFNAIKAAEPAFIVNNLEVIKRASEKEWTAASWLLERRFASNFSRNQTRIKLKQQKPDLSTTDKIMDMVNQVLEQVAAGQMTLEDAKLATAALEEHRKVAETVLVKERVDQIEAKLKGI